MEFTAEVVWGLAVAADRINGGYFSEPYWERPAAGFDSVKTREANKVMVKTWLAQQDFSAMTDEDVAKGQEIRNHIKGYLLKTLSGEISDFEKTALACAQMDIFGGNNLKEFSVISCLPAAMRRDKERLALKREILASVQLQGFKGDRVQGEIQVISCRYNEDYGKYRITALMGESYVDFWYKKELEGVVLIKGKIREQRANNTTQLNYVTLA